MSRQNEVQWETIAVFVAKDPTPRVFPAVRVTVRPLTRYDKSFKDTVAYAFGHVDTRDDTEGKTFRPTLHVRDRCITTFMTLLQTAASHTAVLANNADKKSFNQLAAPLGLVASRKGR